MIGTTSELRLLAGRGMTREELELKKYIGYELRGNHAYLSVGRVEEPTNGHQRKERTQMNETITLSSVAPADASRG